MGRIVNGPGGFGGPAVHQISSRPKTCTLCPLHVNATSNCVQPKGADNPHILFVGEAPGPDEDRMGTPFVGRSGQLLDQLIVAAKITPQVVRWTNAARCAPKTSSGGIDKPAPEYVKTCVWSHLLMEIAQQQPGIIVALGKTAATALTGKRSGLNQMRGYTHSFRFPDAFIAWAETTHGMILYEAVPEMTGGVPPQRFDSKTCRSIEYPVVVTYHPAHALRKKNQSIKGIITADLDYARRKLYGEPRLPGTDYRVLQSFDELDQWATFFERQYAAGNLSYLSVDLETGGADDEAGFRWADPMTEIVTIQIAYEEKKSILIPVSHSDGNFNNVFGIAAIREFMHRVFVRAGIPVVGQNISFDYKWIWAKLGVKLVHIAFDSMLAHQCLFAGDQPNDLDYLSAQYVGMQGYTDGLKAAMEKLPKGLKVFNNLPLNQDYVDYACGDTDAVWRLVPVLTKMLQDENLWATYNHVYLPAIIPLAEMEINGLPIDRDVYEWLRYDLPQELSLIKVPILQSRFYPYFLQAIGCPAEYILAVVSGTAPPKYQKDFEFNPGSSQQKAKMLFEVMGLPINPDKLTDKGAPQTDKAALLELHDTCAGNGWTEHQGIVAAMQEHAVVAKLHSAYILNLPKVVPNQNGVSQELFAPYIPPTFVPWSCHPRLKLDGTQTGRLSSSGPAIHNMPGKSAVKRLFKSRWREYGGCHLQFDYGAMEVRILACKAMANDPVLKAAFAAGYDAHKYVASLIFGIPIDQVTPEQRKVCKTVNFAVLYGAGPNNVAGVVGVTRAQAVKFISDYLGALPDVTRWKAQQEQSALVHGYVRSAFGRIRYLSTQVYSRGEIERRAVNTPIQSSASDVTLTSYIRIYQMIRDHGFQSLPYLFVHDSLGVDCYPGEYFDLWEAMYYEMAVVPPQLYEWLDVPLTVDCDSGYSWGAMASVQRVDRNNWKVVGKEANCGALVRQWQLAGHQLLWTTAEEVVDGNPVSAWYVHVER